MIGLGVDWAGLREGVHFARVTLEHGERADDLVLRAAHEMEEAGHRIDGSREHKTLALFAQLLRSTLDSPRARAIATLAEVEDALD